MTRISTGGKAPRSRHAPGGLNYNACTKVELTQFIKARTGVTRSTHIKKEELANEVRKMDRDPDVFRLMDLPAELRDLIYTEILTLRYGRLGGTLRCEPTILRTSKAVHKEAESVLYGDNEIEAVLQSSMWSHAFSFGRSRRLRGADARYFHPADNAAGSMTLGSLRTAPHLWPHYLQRISKIKIVIDFYIVGMKVGLLNEANVTKLAVNAHHLLLSLISLLSASENLKSLRIEIARAAEAGVTDEHLRSILRPLSLMKGLSTFELSCPSSLTVIQPEVIQAMRSESQLPISVRPSEGFLDKAHRMAVRATHLRDLIRQVGIDNKEDEDKLGARMFQLGELLNSTGFVQEVQEKSILHYTQELESMLTGQLKMDVDFALETKINNLRQLQRDVER